DPAFGGAQVERAVLGEIGERMAGIAALVAVPGGAIEAERLGVGHAAADPRRHARQLAIDVALPRLAAGVDHGVLHVDGIGARAHGEGAADLHAVGAVPDERHGDFFLPAGEAVLAL